MTQFEEAASGLHVPKNRGSTGKRMDRNKLASSIKSAATVKKLVFGAVLVYLAYTTYLFGQENLTNFAMSAAGMLTVSPAAQLRFAKVLAGLAAVLITDGMARAWPAIKRGSTETNAQRIAADVGSIASIVVSFYFTAAVLTQQFPAQFDPRFISGMAFLGAVMFVLISIVNGACVVIFLLMDESNVRQNTGVKIQSNQLTEALSLNEAVREQGLLQAVEDVQSDLPVFASMMRDAMSYQIRTNILSEIEDENVRAQLESKYGGIADMPVIKPAPPPAGSRSKNGNGAVPMGNGHGPIRNGHGG